jgi:hypothetical protein
VSNTISTKHAALYVRINTADKGQAIESQLQPLQEAARRLGWTIAAIHRDEGISGAKKPTARRAGVPFRCHDLRHAFASRFPKPRATSPPFKQSSDTRPSQ